MRISIEFGGFYESTHSCNIENMIEQYYTDDEGETLDYSELDIPYQAIQKEYCRQWLNSFNTEYGTKMAFSGIESPRYYNFETDCIITNISPRDKRTILSLIDDEVIDYIERASASRDGFHSFYNGYNAVKEDETVLLQYAFQYLAYQFNGTAFEVNYELIYQIDMPQWIDQEKVQKDATLQALTLADKLQSYEENEEGVSLRLIDTVRDIYTFPTWKEANNGLSGLVF